MQTEESYPDLDLSNPQVLQKQCENIAIFSARRLRVALGIIFTLATFLIDERIVPPDYASLSVLLTFIIGIPTVFFAILYKCPHCSTVPAGVSYSLSGEKSYTEGMHPFPKRCLCCGYYLSKSELRKDVRKAKKA